MRKFNNLVKFFFFIFSFAFKYMPDFFVNFIWSVSSVFSGYIALSIRYCILKSRCKHVGDNLYIGKYVVLKNLKNISIGENVSVHDYCYIEGFGGVTIGNNVSIAHNSSLVSFEHSWGCKKTPIKYNHSIGKPIIISDDVWIGCGVRVLAGVNIGQRVIVAAGTVAKGNLENASIYAGVPSKRIKEI